MSQHISGNIGQSVSHELGPFIFLNDLSKLCVRKSLITAFNKGTAQKVVGNGDVMPAIGIRLSGGCGDFLAGYATEEERDKVFEQLKWNFENEYRGWEKE